MEAQQLAQAVEKLTVGVGRLRQVNSLNVASITILAFDWLLMLDLEYSLVWKAKWNLTKVVYLLARYLPFIDTSLVMYHQLGFALSKATCQRVFEATAFMFGLGMAIVELVFTLRTWAVWSKSTKFTWGLFSAFAAVWSAILIILGFYIKSLTHQASPVPRLVGCVVLVSSPILSVGFVLLMVYDACLLILMIVRGVAAFRSGGDSHLMRVVYSDGIIYYIYVFALSLLNVLVIVKLPSDYETLLLMLERVVHSTLACRVVLHIRQQASSDEIITGRTTLPTICYESVEMRSWDTPGSKETRDMDRSTHQ